MEHKNIVYEIKLTKEVRKIENFTEIVELSNATEQTRETLDNYIQKKYGDGEEGVLVNMSSHPTKKKPEKYFIGDIKYEPSILEEHKMEDDWNNWRTNNIDMWEREPLLDVKITFPEITKSIIAYHSQRHSNKTLLPCNSLLFYFSIEKEKVVDLWKSGNMKELKKYNIIPTYPQHRNLYDMYGDFAYATVHPNHSVLLDEIYKKRKNKKMQFIAVFTCDEWNRTDVSQFHYNPTFCSYPNASHDNWFSKRGEGNYDPITNEKIILETVIDVNGEEHFGRVGTYKSTIDEKGKLYSYTRNDKPIINYDSDELETYFEEKEQNETD